MAEEKHICSISGCGNPRLAKGWCRKHYLRWYKYGDPLFTKQTPNGELLRYFEEEVLSYDGEECLIWPYGRNAYGYAVMTADGEKQIVSRYLCERTKGAPPSKRHDAAHSCGKGNLGCVTKRHLSWKTRAGNHADKIEHGTHIYGERIAIAKLNDEAVRTMRRLRSSMSLVDIARMYGVSPATAHSAINRKTWAHVA